MPDCPECDHALDTEEANDALANDPDNDYFCPRCGGLFSGGEMPSEGE